MKWAVLTVLGCVNHWGTPFMLLHHYLHRPVLKFFIYSNNLPFLSSLQPPGNHRSPLYLMNWTILVASFRWSRAMFILCVWLTSLLLALMWVWHQRWTVGTFTPNPSSRRLSSVGLILSSCMPYLNILSEAGLFSLPWFSSCLPMVTCPLACVACVLCTGYIFSSLATYPLGSQMRCLQPAFLPRVSPSSSPSVRRSVDTSRGLEGAEVHLCLWLCLWPSGNLLSVGFLRDKCKLDATPLDTVFAVSLGLPWKMSGFTSPCLSWKRKSVRIPVWLCA